MLGEPYRCRRKAIHLGAKSASPGVSLSVQISPLPV